MGAWVPSVWGMTAVLSKLVGHLSLLWVFLLTVCLAFLRSWLGLGHDNNRVRVSDAFIKSSTLDIDHRSLQLIELLQSDGIMPPKGRGGRAGSAMAAAASG